MAKILKPRKITVEIYSAPVTNELGGTKTGSWRTYRPQFNNEKCTKCGLCFDYCPEGVINEIADGYYSPDFDYCKGCGVCTWVCASKAIENIIEES